MPRRASSASLALQQVPYIATFSSTHALFLRRVAFNLLQNDLQPAVRAVSVRDEVLRECFTEDLLRMRYAFTTVVASTPRPYCSVAESPVDEPFGIFLTFATRRFYLIA